MSFWIRLARSACVLWLAVALSGCAPSGGGPLSEEKEPHFVLGKGRVNPMDYPGAIEAFGQSLEANPHSAAAHFELGWLYDEKASDPAAAIFHYQQYLKLNPNADNADVIKQRIYRCKQQLAADVLPLPSAPAAQQQLEKLAEQNRQLQDEVGKWRAYYAGQLAAAKTNTTPTPAAITPEPATNPTPIPSGQNVVATPVVASPDRPANPKADRRQAALAHSRCGRNGGGHRAQVRRETERAGGGQSGHESRPDSCRPGSAPSVAVIGPHDSAPHISCHRGILDRDERAVVARGIRFARRRRFRAGGSGVAENFNRAGRLVSDGFSRWEKNRLLRGVHERSATMAALDEDKLPPEGIVTRAGYQIRFEGNVSLGDFTNRINFTARLQFSSNRAWRELNLKLSSRLATVELHSVAARQAVHLKIASDGVVIEHDFTFADLQNPGVLLNPLAGSFGDGSLNKPDWLAVPPAPAALAGNVRWEAHHERLRLGRELVSAYRLETRVLDQPVVIDISTLGEILRVELPGGLTATLDEWNKA